MIDLHWDMGLVRDAKRFLERLWKLVGFTANVSNVLAAILGRDLRQDDELISMGKGIRRINEGGGHAQGARLHLPSH
jgi:hypothetical protein